MKVKFFGKTSRIFIVYLLCVFVFLFVFTETVLIFVGVFSGLSGAKIFYAPTFFVL